MADTNSQGLQPAEAGRAKRGKQDHNKQYGKRKSKPDHRNPALTCSSPRSRAIRFTRIIILQVTAAKSYGAYVRHNGHNSRKLYISYQLAL